MNDLLCTTSVRPYQVHQRGLIVLMPYRRGFLGPVRNRRHIYHHILHAATKDQEDLRKLKRCSRPTQHRDRQSSESYYDTDDPLSVRICHPHSSALGRKDVVDGPQQHTLQQRLRLLRRLHDY